MKFKLSPELIVQFPKTVEYIVIARGLNNEIAGKWILDETKEAIASAREKGETVLQEPRFKKWLDVYSDVAKTVGLKQKDYFPSHVALLKRVLAGKDLPNISPVVNFYNLYSVRYGVPIGGENLAAVYGDQNLEITSGGEKFLEIGSSKADVLGKGEVVWKDAHSVTCRVWNWRQCDRTKLTRATKDMYFIFDTFRDISDITVHEIVNTFASELSEKFGASVAVEVLDREHPEYEVEYQTKEISGVDVYEEFASHTKESVKTVKTPKNAFMSRKPQAVGLSDQTTVTARLGKLVASAAGQKEGIVTAGLQQSADPEFGDFSSTIAFQLAGKLHTSPKQIADDLAKELNESKNRTMFSKVSVAEKGFVNFTLSNQALLSELVVAMSKRNTYGCSNAGERRTILVESPSINPDTSPHVGHLLNLLIGRSLARLLTKVGFEVAKDNLINDKGIPIFQALWGIRNLANGKTPQSENLKPDHFVGKYYVLGKKQYEADPKVKEDVNTMLRDWEKGQPEIRQEWKQMIDWAFEGQRRTFARLHEELGFLWMESDLYQHGKDIVHQYLGKGIVEQLPDGAVVGRIEEKYGVPDVILIKADGSALYHTQDVYLTLQKIEKFQPWRAVWVVGHEQITHFQRLFALLDALKILPVGNLYHYAYAWVVDKQGDKIKARDGGAMTVDGILDMMHAAALKALEQRHIQVDLKDKDVVAEAVGQGALRYAFLSHDPFRNITFDPDEAVSFTGRSGPYIMYTYSRGRSVLRKALGDHVDDYRVGDIKKIKASSLDIAQEERALLIKLLLYPETVLSAANAYAPNVLAEFLYDVASLFNNFYEKYTIAGAAGDQKAFRVVLTQLMTTVLKDGLTILGIDALEKM